MSRISYLAVLTMVFGFGELKKLSPCELAKDLAMNEVPHEEIPTWTCVAGSLSGYDTRKIKKDTGPLYGIFQIPASYCHECEADCDDFIDDDLSDDIDCATYVHWEEYTDRKIWDDCDKPSKNPIPRDCNYTLPESNDAAGCSFPHVTTVGLFLIVIMLAV